ncbi:MAG: diguanylate cyclase [Cryomorphaceae bacterium]|nr:diguanylate cyclase [Cryomorphaceae bacterium]
MASVKPLIFLVILLNLSVSCAQSTSNKEGSTVAETRSIAKSGAVSDTLKFTSDIRSIFQDSKGNYWLGSHQEGVCMFDGTSFRYFTVNEGLTDQQVRAIQEDAFGNMWFDTANGASMYDGAKFTNYPSDANNPQSEWKVSAENLWFNAGVNEGVRVFDGERMNYFSFSKTASVEPFSAHQVTGISKGVDGKVWIATYDDLFCFDGEKLSMLDGLSAVFLEGDYLHIRSVLADSKGRLWIGNNGIGVLLHYGEKTVNFSDEMGLIDAESKRDGDKSPSGTLEHVFAIHEDAVGNIWFSDRDTGVWRFDGEKMSNYTISAQTSNPMVWCIYSDSNGNLLFGAADGNVYKFNGDSFSVFF